MKESILFTELQLRRNLFDRDSKLRDPYDLWDRIVVHLGISITQDFFFYRELSARSITNIIFYWSRFEVRLQYHDQIFVCMMIIFFMNQSLQYYITIIDELIEIILHTSKISYFQKYQKDSVEN